MEGNSILLRGMIQKLTCFVRVSPTTSVKKEHLVLMHSHKISVFLAMLFVPQLSRLVQQLIFLNR